MSKTRNDSDGEGNLQQINNKLARILSDTSNINRIMTLNSSGQIIEELWKVVGRSEVRAAILHFAVDDISAHDLAEKVGIAPENLAATMKPFLGRTKIIVATEEGRERHFQRSELVDLVNFEAQPKFIEMMKSFEERRNKGSIPADLTKEESQESA